MQSLVTPSASGVRSERRFAATAGTPFESLATSLRLLRRLLADQLAADGLLATDFWALTGIRNGVNSPTALGRTLAITPAGVTQLLDRLERRQLLRRRPDATDRRATVLELTPLGRAVERRARVQCARFLNHVALELTPAGRTALERLSRELDGVLAREVPDGPPRE